MANGIRYVLASGHRDAPLSRVGKVVWWTILGVVIGGGIVLIAVVRG